MSGGDVSVLLSHHPKALRLPVFLREYPKVAAPRAKETHDSARFPLESSELELIEREKKGTERRVRDAGFPVIKALEGFDFTAFPGLNKPLVLELAGCEYLPKRENVLAVGNSGTGKTHIAIALGLSACHAGHAVKFFTTASLVTAQQFAKSPHMFDLGCIDTRPESGLRAAHHFDNVSEAGSARAADPARYRT